MSGRFPLRDSKQHDSAAFSEETLISEEALRGTTRGKVLEVIRDRARKLRPATVREIGDQLGLRSSASVHRHLKRLEEVGLIRRDPAAGSRNWQPVDAPPSAHDSIPLVGRIAAGQPITCCTDGGGQAPEWLPFPPSAFGSTTEVVALEVEGTSMKDAGILAGDLAVVRRQPTVEMGEIAAVTIDGEGTLKRWRTDSSNDKSKRKKRIRLEGANDEFAALEIDPRQHNIEVFGKLVGVLRHFGRR